jgi:hypothetical protein
MFRRTVWSPEQFPLMLMVHDPVAIRCVPQLIVCLFVPLLWLVLMPLSTCCSERKVSTHPPKAALCASAIFPVTCTHRFVEHATPLIFVAGPLLTTYQLRNTLKPKMYLSNYIQIQSVPHRKHAVFLCLFVATGTCLPNLCPATVYFALPRECA